METLPTARLSGTATPASLNELSWPVSQVGDALTSLARHSGLSLRVGDAPHVSHAWKDEALEAGIVSTAEWLGLEAEPVEATYPDLPELLSGSGPALLRLPGEGSRFLALIRGGRRSIQLLGPDLATHRLPLEQLVSALVRDHEASVSESVERLLDQAGISLARRTQARSVMLKERLSHVIIGDCWLVRLPAGAAVWEQVRAAELPKYVVGFCGTHTLANLLGLASWFVLGKAALEGRLDRGWLLAWVLLLFTLVPFRLFATWYQGLFSVAAGALLKKRLLEGALRLHPDETRLQGSGHHLGRVIESEAVETLALRGGFLALMSVIDLLLAGLVLSAGAGGGVLVLILLAWTGVTAYLGRRFYLQRQRWTRARLQISHELVEKMVGYRTRLAQQTPERWHHEEDQELSGYLDGSQDVDRTAVKLALMPRAWVAVALLGLAPTFLSGEGSVARVAVSLGGIVLAYRAMERLREGFSFLADAAIAWQQVAPLFLSAERQDAPGDPRLLALDDHASSRANGPGAPVLEARDLVFQYASRGEPVIRRLSLQLRAGERAVMKSPSGGGKSTLVSLLSGLRTPQSGSLLLGSLDRSSIGGEGWTRRVAAAPQFNENHVFTETFAFNLLMGRGWPARAADLDDAEEICRELGLGELLERMPGGLLQMVGETGWQLSHGERSRLFIARALLQGADLVILDESFAALDPDNLRLALDCALRRAPSLLVISHS